MKRHNSSLTVLAGIILFAFGCSKSENVTTLDCLPSSLQTGIIAFYAFNSGSLDDTSGNNHDLSNPTTAAPGADRDGNASCAFYFNSANNEFLKFTNPAFLDDLQSGQFSISVWYRSEVQGGTIMSRGNDIGNCHGGAGEWNLALWDNNWPTFFINSGRNIADTPTYQENEWHHLVVTNNANDTKIYQDGTLIGDDEFVVCTAGSGPSLNIGDLFIGENFKGTLDDIIIYDRELSPAEITQLAELAPCCQ